MKFFAANFNIPEERIKQISGSLNEMFRDPFCPYKRKLLFNQRNEFIEYIIKYMELKKSNEISFITLFVDGVICMDNYLLN